MKLWEKSGASLNKDIEWFEVGSDYIYDLSLAPFDVYGNAAHAKMLNKLGILNDEELKNIIETLSEIKKKIDSGNFKLEIHDEDIHTKIENILTEKLGDMGKKIHTARSRNDQVLLDIRLYSKYNLYELALNIIDFARDLLQFAKKYEFIPMPGYTHMQPAMPSSVGMWASSFVENIIDELNLLSAIMDLNDMNPLGSGAGYGVSLNIDRILTTELLGFKRIQKNSIYCGNSRGKVESHILNSISGFALILNRIATDLLIFTTKEFGFFEIKGEITTGSSIMPQKKNLDVLELIRGRTHILLGNEVQIKQIISNLPSGYNRDYQETKHLLIDSFDIIKVMFSIMRIVFANIQPNENRLRNAMYPEIYATDAAYELVKKGMPFRDAYRKIGQNLDELKQFDPVENIKNKTHIGSTGNLILDDYETDLIQLKNKFNQEFNSWKGVLEQSLKI